jgi:hypothetical protein
MLMEAAIRILEKGLAFLVTIVTSGNELLVVVSAGVFFILGLILLYRKGPWLGIPFTVAGILLVVMAILSRLLPF